MVKYTPLAMVDQEHSDISVLLIIFKMIDIFVGGDSATSFSIELYLSYRLMFN